MYINVDIGVTRASLTWMQARSGACFFVALPRFSFCRSATRCSIGWAGTTASRRASASMSWPVIQLLDLPSMNKHLLQAPVCMGISDFQNSSTGKTKLRSPRVGKVIGYCVPKISHWRFRKETAVAPEIPRTMSGLGTAKHQIQHMWPFVDILWYIIIPLQWPKDCLKLQKKTGWNRISTSFTPHGFGIDSSIKSLKNGRSPCAWQGRASDLSHGLAVNAFNYPQ